LEEAHFGNEIVVAEDGEEVLDFLYKRGKFANDKSEDPVFILLDIKMPLMDGIFINSVKELGQYWVVINERPE